jgi:hypothetical protein
MYNLGFKQGVKKGLEETAKPPFRFNVLYAKWDRKKDVMKEQKFIGSFIDVRGAKSFIASMRRIIGRGDKLIIIDKDTRKEDSYDYPEL